jgi:phage gpG-like protein
MAQSEVKLNSKEWNKLINKISKNLKNIVPILKPAVNVFGFKDINDHFQREQNPKGRWAKLKYRKGKPLQDTGNLRNSFLPARRQGRDAVLMINNAPYAGIHNYGKGRMHREFMWLSQGAQENILNYIMNKLV